MSDQNRTLKDRKLKNLRKIMWIIFAGISVSLLVLMVPLMIVLGGPESSVWMVPSPTGDLVSMFPFLLLSPLMMIGFVGVVLLVIYYIFKYRLERDEELFL